MAPQTDGSDDSVDSHRSADRGLRAVLFGTPGAEFNLGVQALRLSLLHGFLRRRPDSRLVTFDDGRVARTALLTLDSGAQATYALLGARNSRRLHRPESYANMRLSARLGGLANPGARAVRTADAVLDVSGGDSFADIYGARRFQTVSLPKRLALDNGRPLVLLPQTYGPFKDATIRRQAEMFVRAARVCWARDVDSYAALLELAGSDADPDCYRRGVDMAFSLPIRRPTAPGIADDVEAFCADGPVAGVNVSGLLYNDPAARAHFGLACDYAVVTRRLVTQLLGDGARVLLVPHVLGTQGPLESDTGACLDLMSRLTPAQRERVHLLPNDRDATQTKWVIARTSWFAGARMHATIAGLSSGVPTHGVAYSMKFAGVFESCGQRERALDARALDTEEMLECLLEGWRTRNAARDQSALRGVIASAERQMDDIVSTVAACAADRLNAPRRLGAAR